MFNPAERRAMKRAMELASLGGKKVFPNPKVGAVILSPSGETVAEGFHEFFGGAHAEINALMRADDVIGCTMVVTLEPCSHYGKTPPCVEAIADSGVSRVVVGLEDPNPLVSGEGIKFLTGRGIEVEVGLFKEEIQKMNEVYLHYISKGRSFLHLKMAGTLDGRSAACDGSSRWITGPESRKRVHGYRCNSHAVLVGRGTAVADDPELTARSVNCAPEDQPARIIYANKSLPFELRLFSTPGRTIVATAGKQDFPAGIEVWKDIQSPAELLVKTAVAGLGLVFCEGGSTLAASLLKSRLVDRLSIFTAPALLGESGYPVIGDLGIRGIGDILRLEDVTVNTTGEDILTEGRVVYRSD